MAINRYCHHTIWISWGSSDSESTEWYMKATRDGFGSLVYTGGIKTEIVYNDDGSVKEEKIIWDDASGSLTLNAEGKLLWTDSYETSASECVFSK